MNNIQNYLKKLEAYRLRQRERKILENLPERLKCDIGYPNRLGG